jgi:hypothetical protein
MKAVIHFARIGKPESIYTETLVQDDGIRLDTVSSIPPELASSWSKRAWQAHGILAEGQIVATVRKHHYYNEWFDIIELLDAAGAHLGFYCDVITPLQKQDGHYYLQDLLLDLWIWPSGQYKELDWDEFHEAAQAGLLSPELQNKAIATLGCMVAELEQGVFPYRYLPAGQP